MPGVFKVIDEAEAVKISQRLESFKAIIRRPPNQDDYQKLNKLAADYNAALSSIQKKISESSAAYCQFRQFSPDHLICVGLAK
jgi:hypothetical protein